MVVEAKDKVVFLFYSKRPDVKLQVKAFKDAVRIK
jgi:hypothetical protein